MACVGTREYLRELIAFKPQAESVHLGYFCNIRKVHAFLHNDIESARLHKRALPRFLSKNAAATADTCLLKQDCK